MLLKYRLSLIYSGLLACVLTAVGILLYFSEKEHLYFSVEQEQKQTLGKLAELCRQYILSDGDTVLDLTLLNYFRELKQTTGVESAFLLDPDGIVLNTADENGSALKFKGQLIQNAVRSRTFLRQEYGKYISVSQPIFIGQHKSGVAEIIYSSLDIEHRVRGALVQSLHRFILVVFFAFGLGLTGIAFLSPSITRPIEKIAESAKRVGQGNLNVQIGMSRNDELGALIVAFNQMVKRLRELDELKEDFICTVTHELRNPLHGILGYADILLQGRSGSINEKQTYYLTIIKNAAERLGRFVNNILDLAKLEAGLMDMERSPVSMKKAIAEVKMILAPQLELNGISLLKQLNEQDVYVLADRDKLSQILVNLVANAIKFSQPGGEITVWARANGECVQVGVRDQGVGIPKEDIPKLFNKFEQVKSTRDKAKGEGTGLGLAIVKRLVELQGGTIRVESELWHGAEFIFTMPKNQESCDSV